jgi:hypothetical protein
MEIKKTRIVICGDSFCSSHNYERDHFSQILEDSYGYDVINLARGGTGTIGICYQIQQAVFLNCDVVIYSRTNPGRLEVPLTDKKFDPKLGLRNFLYHYPDETSYGSPYVGGPDAPFLSQIFNMLIPQTDPKEKEIADRYVKLSDELKQAVQVYITHIWDPELKRETDRWAYEYWEYRCRERQIKIICFNDHAQEAYDFAKSTNGQYPKVYHTDLATQLKVADKLHRAIIAY